VPPSSVGWFGGRQSCCCTTAVSATSSIQAALCHASACALRRLAAAVDSLLPLLLLLAQTEAIQMIAAADVDGDGEVTTPPCTLCQPSMHALYRAVHGLLVCERPSVVILIKRPGRG
jgi:hypothetical protein